MNIKRISAYTIENEPGKPALDFDEYSRFKYGHKATAIKFAERMAQEFVKNFTLDFVAKDCSDVIVSTSPYWYTPPSANALATYFHFILNELMLETNHSPLTFIKIHRSAAPACDFSKLSHTERIENMKKDRISLDPSLLKDKTLILIEDARITGAHEKKIIDFMQESGVEDLIFVYVIDVGFGKDDPEIESRLNHKWVHNLDTIHLLMKNPEQFLINARLCRFILAWENKEELKDFCKRLRDEMLFGLYMSSINDCYNSVEKYRPGFEIIRAEIEFRYRQLKKSDFQDASIFIPER